MDLITPGIGLIFWTLIIFSILLFVLRKYAWRPVNNAVKTREQTIRAALQSAENAKKEMEKLKSDNERILLEAKNERDAIMKEARDVKEKFIAEAKKTADEEAKKMINVARKTIENERASVISDIKEQIARLSVDVAEKVLREKLKDEKEGRELVDRLLKEIELN